VKRNILSVTYYIDPHYKRHIEIPLARVGALLLGVIILTAWGVVSAIRIAGPVAARNNAPAVASVAPAVASVAPAVASVAPAVASVAPAVASVAPPVASVAPAVASVAPAVASVAPAVASVAPAVASVAPAVPTVTPVTPVLAVDANFHDPIVMRSRTLSEAPAPQLGVALADVRITRDDSGLRVKITIENQRGESSEAAGIVTGVATFAAMGDSPLTIRAQEELTYKAKRASTKVLRFPYPPRAGRFREVEVMVLDAGAEAPLVSRHVVPGKALEGPP
jgi:hypothetical protein